ncbi:MAG: hypothetical protein L7S54_00970, partial [Candidatus Thalassarchaeaceae archaeon]|nr:hypothetical protein [Candidatus Thalassarchaeaceae archaeon]
MRQLVEAEQFASVASTLVDAAAGIRTHRGTVMLLAAPSIIGSLSLAPLEAAMLDLGMPYRRRFRLQ